MKLNLNIFITGLIVRGSEAHLRKRGASTSSALPPKNNQRIQEEEDAQFWDRFLQVTTTSYEGANAAIADSISDCCDPKDFLFCFIGVAGCCPNGQWACTFDANGELYRCGDDEVSFPQGRICDENASTFPSSVPDYPGDGSTFPSSVPYYGDGSTFPSSVPYYGDGSTFPSSVPYSGSSSGPTSDPDEALFCTADVQECPDGSFVSRDPQNDCAFRPCPDFDGPPYSSFPSSVPYYGDGSTFPSSVPYSGFSSGPTSDPDELLFCTADVQGCPDGSFVSRDPQNDCAFRPCPDEYECCDPLLEPGMNGNPFCTDGYVCCTSGEWSCGIGDGTFPCAGDIVTATDHLSEACSLDLLATSAPSE